MSRSTSLLALLILSLLSPAHSASAADGSGRKGPALARDVFDRPRVQPFADLARWQQAFDLLIRLIEKTPDSDPEKPELYFRLAGLHWERAVWTEVHGFDEERRCLSETWETDRERCHALRDPQTHRKEAISVLKHLVREFPGYPQLDEVLFWLATSFMRGGDAEGAKRVFVELIRRYPRSARMADTLLNLGEIYFDGGQMDQAVIFYAKVAEDYPAAPVHGFARYKLGWCFVHLERYPEALEQWVAVIELADDQPKDMRRKRLKREAQVDLAGLIERLVAQGEVSEALRRAVDSALRDRKP